MHPRRVRRVVHSRRSFRASSQTEGARLKKTKKRSLLTNSTGRRFSFCFFGKKAGIYSEIIYCDGKLRVEARSGGEVRGERRRRWGGRVRVRGHGAQRDAIAALRAVCHHGQVIHQLQNRHGARPTVPTHPPLPARNCSCNQKITIICTWYINLASEKEPPTRSMSRNGVTSTGQSSGFARRMPFTPPRDLEVFFGGGRGRINK